MGGDFYKENLRDQIYHSVLEVARDNIVFRISPIIEGNYIQNIKQNYFQNVNQKLFKLP